MVQQGTFKSVAMYLNRTYYCTLYNTFFYLFWSTFVVAVLSTRKIYYVACTTMKQNIEFKKNNSNNK